MDSDLMPLKTEAPKCSEFTRSLSVNPLGSGLRIDRVILAAVPSPWPKPALNHSALRPAVASITGSQVSSRLFASEPRSDHPLTVEVFERAGLATTHHCWRLESDLLITPLLEAISSASLHTLGEVVIDGVVRTLAGPVTRPMFLVCTQGSHDACCGTFGGALADLIEADRPDYEVRRVSHTGGHRFAPTFMAFPSGRMWALADLDIVDRVAQGHETSTDFLHNCRGWWGVDAGAPQVAECVARASHERAFSTAPEVEIEAGANGQTDCVVRVDGLTIGVTVEVSRQVPTIACEAPGGLPAKAGREFAAFVNTTRE